MTQERDSKTGKFVKKEDEFETEMGLGQVDPTMLEAAQHMGLGLHNLGSGEKEESPEFEEMLEAGETSPVAEPVTETPVESAPPKEEQTDTTPQAEEKPTELTVEQFDQISDEELEGALQKMNPTAAAKLMREYRAKIAEATTLVNQHFDEMAQAEYLRQLSAAGASSAPSVEQSQEKQEESEILAIDPIADPAGFESAMERRILSRLEKQGKIPSSQPVKFNDKQQAISRQYLSMLSKRHPDFVRLVPVMRAIVTQHPEFDNPAYTLTVLNAARQAVKTDPQLVEKLQTNQPVVLGTNPDEIKVAAQAGEKSAEDKKKAAANVLADSTGTSGKDVNQQRVVEMGKKASSIEPELQAIIDAEGVEDTTELKRMRELGIIG